MRISIDQDDPGYTRKRYRVLLDGTDLRDVVMADEEAGEVEILERNALGDYLLTEDRSAVRRVKLRGRVALIELPGERPF